MQEKGIQNCRHTPQYYRDKREGNRMAFVMTDMRIRGKWMGNPQSLLSLIFHGIRINMNVFVLKMAYNILNV
jgi:hypothetical protein